MKIKPRVKSRFTKKARKGFRGYPVATVAFYGPDDTQASKVVVGIFPRENTEPSVLRKWFSDETDLRIDAEVGAQIAAFIQRHGVLTVSAVDRIIGCPHEEGIDYPDGQPCPQCPFWAKRDRWTGELLS